MKRAITTMLFSLVFGLAASPAVSLAATKHQTKHQVKDVSVPGGIGATRASFDLTYGAPKADIFGDFEKKLHTDDANDAMPKSQGMTIDVEFVVTTDNKERDGDRAFDMIISPPDGASWSLVDANTVVDLVLPKDAKATSALAPVAGVATASYDWEEQTFMSAYVAKVIPDKSWYRNDQIGLITVSLQPGNPGEYNQLTVGTDVN